MTGTPVGCVGVWREGGKGEGQLALLGSGVVGWLPGSGEVGESSRVVSQEGRKNKIRMRVGVSSGRWLWVAMEPQQQGRKEGRRGRGGGAGGRGGGRVSHAKDDPVRIDTSADIAECLATCIPLPIKMRARIDSPRLPCGSMEGCRCLVED